MPETLVCLRETQVREPPGEILLIPFGKVEYTKDNKVGSFNFDSESAQKILAEFSERGRDLVIDYEHQTLSGEQAPAAGWIEKLELNERGVVGKMKYWTADAENYLRNGEYRYFSPTIRFDENGQPCALHSVALTNHPALHHVDALVASDLKTSGKPDNHKGGVMPEEKKEPVAFTDDQVVSVAREILGLSDATAENVRGKLLALKTQAELVPGLRSRVSELEQAADSEARKQLLLELCETGRLTNAQAESDYFKNRSLADLQSYREATPEGTMVPTKKVTQPERKEPEGDKPSPILKNLGLSEEDMKKMKAKEAGNGCAQ